MSEYNFKDVAPAESSSFLRPGIYELKAFDANYVKPEGTKEDGSAKTPYLEVIFKGEDGQVTEKFYVNPKTLPRLQYLFLAWFGSKVDKAFENSDQVGAYFEKAFKAGKDKFKHRVIVGGKQSDRDGKIYAGLPYSGFVIADEIQDVETGPFEENSYNWNTYVQMAKNVNIPAGNDVMVPSGGGSSTPENTDDLPF